MVIMSITAYEVKLHLLKAGQGGGRELGGETDRYLSDAERATGGA